MLSLTHQSSIHHLSSSFSLLLSSLEGLNVGAAPPAQDPLVGLAHEAHQLHDAHKAEPDAEAHEAADVGHEAGEEKDAKHEEASVMFSSTLNLNSMEP